MADRSPHTESAGEAMSPLVGVCILYIVLDIFFVTVRFVSRLFIRRSEVGWDVCQIMHSLSKQRTLICCLGLVVDTSVRLQCGGVCLWAA